MNGYVNTMTADIALTERFGSVDLKDEILRIQDYYKAQEARY